MRRAGTLATVHTEYKTHPGPRLSMQNTPTPPPLLPQPFRNKNFKSKIAVSTL